MTGSAARSSPSGHASASVTLSAPASPSAASSASVQPAANRLPARGSACAVAAEGRGDRDRPAGEALLHGAHLIARAVRRFGDGRQVGGVRLRVHRPAHRVGGHERRRREVDARQIAGRAGGDRDGRVRRVPRPPGAHGVERGGLRGVVPDGEGEHARDVEAVEVEAREGPRRRAGIVRQVQRELERRARPGGRRCAASVAGAASSARSRSTRRWAGFAWRTAPPVRTPIAGRRPVRPSPKRSAPSARSTTNGAGVMRAASPRSVRSRSVTRCAMRVPRGTVTGFGSVTGVL